MTRTAMPARRRALALRFPRILVLALLLAWSAASAQGGVLPPGSGAFAAPDPAPSVAPQEPGEEDEEGAPRDQQGSEGDEAPPERDEEAAAPEEEEGGEARGEEDDAASEARVEFAAFESELRARRGGEPLWTLPLPVEGGPTSTRELGEERLYLTHGLYLLEIDRTDGTILRRIALPAPGLEILEVDDDRVRLTVDHGTGDGEEVEVPLQGDEAVRFGVDRASFGWLRAGAAARERPADDLERDPDNAWLAFEAARAASDDDVREEYLDVALAAAEQLPFFEAAHLARALAGSGEHDRAEQAMESALTDFAERDYDPRLLTDPALREAYGFPLEPAREAARQGDVRSMELWAPYLWRLASEEAPETLEGLNDVSRSLREAGERDAADLWRSRASDLRRAGLSTWLDRAALSLGRFGWAGVAALLAAFVLAWITLLAKVWRAQSLARMQRRERAEPVRPWSRAWVPRQASTTEKICLVLILVAAGFLATLAGWATRADEVPEALRSGTLASVPARQALAELPDTPHAHVARGVSLHVRGRGDEAETAYRNAGERATALVNLALLTGDEALLQAALRVDPRQQVARFHLGRAANPSPFHEVYGGNDPLLAVPSPLEFALAAGGDWRDALRETATAPWRALEQARPEELSAWAWWPILVAYGLLLLALIVQLFVPRPRVSRYAPRTAAYHPLALLIPGSGHLDELWGLLLLIPWSLIGLDALLYAFGGGGALGLSLATELWLLAIFWLANLAGFVIETASYRRRMRRLRETKPELARSYGLPLRPVKTDT